MDYFDYGLDPEANPSGTGFDVEEFLESSQEREEERLEKELAQVKEQLEERDQIHDEAVSELESKLDWYLDRLELLYQRGGSPQAEKAELKQSIEEFYRLIREEQRRRWRDQQELEREKREILSELDKVEDWGSDVSDFL